LFNNREIATAIWLTIFVVWILTKPDVRQSFTSVFRAFFQWKIVTCVAAMAAYVSACIYLFWSLGLWVPLMTKDAILWFLLTGFVMLMQFMTDRQQKSVFRFVIRENIKLLIFIEFLIGAYTFPLWVEMFFVPLVTILLMLDTFAGTSDEYKDVKTFAGWIVAAIGFGLLYFAITRAVGDWRNLGTADTIRSIVFAPLMSIAFAPFVYGSMVVAAYENLFVRLEIGREKPPSVKRYAKSRIIKHCGLSLSKLRQLATSSFRLNTVETNDDVDRVFAANAKIAG
jgi:hypothetical protein